MQTLPFGPGGFGFNDQAIAELEKLALQIQEEIDHLTSLEATVLRMIQEQVTLGGPIVALQEFFQAETPQFRKKLTDMSLAVNDQSTFLKETKAAAEAVIHRTQSRVN